MTQQRLCQARDWLSVFSCRGSPAGKSTGGIVLATEEWIRDVKRTGTSCCQEKPLVSESLPVPQTDTGRQVEDTKACEITIVKELGKLTP